MDNVEIKISAMKDYERFLFPLFKSLKLLLPCFVPVLLIVPENQESFFLNLLSDIEFRTILDHSDLLLIKIQPEKAPSFIHKVGKFYQHNIMILSLINYTSQVRQNLFLF